MSARPPGVLRIRGAPQKINTFPPRYRGFLENRYGPVVMRCFCAWEHDHVHAAHVKVECSPCPQQEACGNKRTTKLVRKGTLEVGNPQEMIDASAEQRHDEPDRDDEDIMEHAL
jgi:hypothetical protein